MEAVSISWKLVHALSTNAHDFWPALQAFVRLAFHCSFLKMQDVQSHKITACIQQVSSVGSRASEFAYQNQIYRALISFHVHLKLLYLL